MRVLITGTTSGIGKVLSELYASQGHEVLSVNRPERKGTFVLGRSDFLDITNFEEVKQYFELLKKQAQLPNAVILMAGINELDNSGTFDHAVFEKVMRVNVFGTSTFIAAIQSLGLTGIKIVTISSLSAVFPNVENLAYYLSKWSVLKMIKLLAQKDPQNSYQSVVLGPVESRMTNSDEHMSAVKKFVFKTLIRTPQQAAVMIQGFANSKRRVIYWPKLSAAVYFAAACAASVLDTLLGPRPKK